MKKLSIVLALTVGLLSTCIRAASWTPVQTIPATSPPSETDVPVSLAYDSTHNLMFAAWVDFSTAFPFFSIFDNTSGIWSTPAPIANTPGFDTISLSYDSLAQIMIATWVDSISDNPVYSVYNGTSWSSAATISNTLHASGSVLTVFDVSTGNIIAAWGDFNHPNNPYYSTYNANANTWTVPQTITTQPVQDFVALAYNNDTGQVFAAWIESGTLLPFYAILTAGVWTTGPISLTEVGDNDVGLTYDATNGQMYAAWGTTDPLVATFPNTNPTWSTPIAISILGTLNSSVALGYASSSGQVIASWYDNLAFPHYAITDSTGANWTEGAISPNPIAQTDIGLAFNTGLDEMFAAWSNGTDPVYSTLSVAPASAVSFTGVVRRNQFLNRAECVLFASWTASPSASVVLYRIYKNGLLVQTVSAGSILSFRTCSCSANGLSGYAIAAVDNNGLESTHVPLSITTVC